MRKAELRKMMKERKALLTPEVLAHADAFMTHDFLLQPVLSGVKSLMIYVSIPGEVPTLRFLETVNDKTIVLPRINGDTLEPRLFTGMKDLVPDPKYHILEPTGPEFRVEEKLDVIVVPGVAFDAAGHRLGRGGGYYDRFLHNESYRHVRRVGLCFDFQMVDKVPVDDHDMSMDAVIVVPTGLKF